MPHAKKNSWMRLVALLSMQRTSTQILFVCKSWTYSWARPRSALMPTAYVALPLCRQYSSCLSYSQQKEKNITTSESWLQSEILMPGCCRFTLLGAFPWFAENCTICSKIHGKVILIFSLLSFSVLVNNLCRCKWCTSITCTAVNP